MSIANLGLPRGPADLDALAAAAGSQGGGGLPPPGLPDPALLTRLANAFFTALPGEPVPSLPSLEAPSFAGTSLPGLGASPTGVAGAVPNPVAIPSSAPSIPAANSGCAGRVLGVRSFGNTGARQSVVSVGPVERGHVAGGWWLRRFAVHRDFGNARSRSWGLPGRHAGCGDADVRFRSAERRRPRCPCNAGADERRASVSPQTIDTGAIAGHAGTINTPPSHAGGAPVAGVQNGANHSSIPQPPPANPPDQVLVDNSGITTPPSGGSANLGSPIALPFEKELRLFWRRFRSQPCRPCLGRPLHRPIRGSISSTGCRFRDIRMSPARVQPRSIQRNSQSAHPAFDIHSIRRDFPILRKP